MDDPLRLLHLFILPFFTLGLSCCTGDDGKTEVSPDESILIAETSIREDAREIAKTLDDFSLAAQVLMTGIDGDTRIAESMQPLLERIPVGACMLFRYNLRGEKEGVRSFLTECSALIAGTGAGLPSGLLPRLLPFIAVDHEGGLVHRFGPGVERLPPAFSYWELAQSSGRGGALKTVEEDAFRSGREIRELGINLNLAPVAEILSVENQPFLETRSYGPDPAFATAATAAFIRGMGNAGIACTAKHFPGNSGADPHTGRAVLTEGGENLDRMAAVFAELIHSQPPPFIMISHVMVPAWDGERNASLSPRIMGDWLREKLGFQGVILADDFSMGAVASSGIRPEDAAVDALIAGADMVMVWPSNLAITHRAILAALDSGRLNRDRLLDAAARIIAEKIRFGLVEY